MKRVAAVFVLAAVLSGYTASTSQACGDKFLVQSRGQRYSRMHAAVHPRTILILHTSDATRDVIKPDLRRTLEDVGHTVYVCEGQLCDLAVSSGRYDIIMTDAADASKVEEQVKTLMPRPVVIPVVSRGSKEETARLNAEFPHVYNAHSRPGRLLALIDGAMSGHN